MALKAGRKFFIQEGERIFIVNRDPNCLREKRKKRGASRVTRRDGTKSKYRKS